MAGSDENGVVSTVRGDEGATILGPRNIPLELENPDLMASPYTDSGTVPNLKFSFAAARNRILPGGWAREVTARELPVATTLAVLPRQVVTRLLIVLAAAAGCVDVMALSRLGGPFASLVTGNLIQLGRGLALPNGHLAASTSTAVASYAVGVAAGTGMLRGSPPGWRLRTCVVTAVELFLLVGLLVGWLITSGSPGTGQAPFLLALAAAAMGLQSVATLSTGVPEASTTYMTGTLTSFMRAVATDPHLIGAGGAGIARLLSLLAGAIVGALILKFAPSWAPVFPVVLIAGTVVLASVLVGSVRGGWPESRD